MGGFKRLCMAVFSLAGLAALAALALSWYGPWTPGASALLAIDWYAITVSICVAIAAVGLVVVLVRAIFAPRAPHVIEVATVDGGQISVTRDAIAAQAAHVVEADGTCTAERVSVDVVSPSRVRVGVRVLPHSSMDIVATGSRLHEDLARGLAAICGDTVEDISLVFEEPEEVTQVGAGDKGVAVTGEMGASAGAAAPDVPRADDDADSTSEITVPIGTFHDTERGA